MAPGLLLKKTNQLKPYLKNARTHSKEQVASVANSIKEFGFTNPILLGKGDVIIAGHCRLLAAQELGLSEVPCLDLSQLTKKQTQAYVLADNQLAQNSGWDMGILKSEIEELQDLGFDLDLLGFSQDFLDELLADDEPVNELTDGDAIPEDVDTRCKLGDVWLLGEHRLMCGDSAQTSDVDKLTQGYGMDLVFTDPPYNLASENKLVAANTSKAMQNLKDSAWDKNFSITEVLQNIIAYLSEDATVYIFTSNHLAGEIWAWMKPWASHYSWCVWQKTNPMPSLMKRHWTWNGELICYATRGKHTFNFPKEGHALSIWDFTKGGNETEHPTEKPIKVALHAITHSSKKDDHVLDLFGGSGSTLIACEKANRKCFMMELDPKYCDVILKRWEDFTGKSAVMEVSNG